MTGGTFCIPVGDILEGTDHQTYVFGCLSFAPLRKNILTGASRLVLLSIGDLQRAAIDHRCARKAVRAATVVSAPSLIP
jgi:hypothetical protein